MYYFSFPPSKCSGMVGYWQDTRRDKLYEQLVWESLHSRREFRRLTQFYKIMNNLTPGYLREPVPDPLMHLFGPRSTNVLPQVPCRNDRYRNSFYPDAISSWNSIGVEFRSIVKLSDFKSAVLQTIRPPRREIFGVHDPGGIERIFQLRVGLSPLRAHKRAHGFQDTPDGLCLCGGGMEDTTHFLISCPFFSSGRSHLFLEVTKICPTFGELSPGEKTYCLLYGYFGLNDTLNSQIIKQTIHFIRESNRFSRDG